MIGETKAAAIFTNDGDKETITLQWLSGDTQYNLSSGAYDLKTMISIAESIS